MEFQNLQKGFFEQADSNSADDRSVFIRKTYSLLLLEYFIVGGISLLFFQLVFWVRLWVFVIIMIICQLCHFYFEMSQIGDQDQQKKILNYIFCTVHLICLTFTFFFLWNLFTEQYFGYIWIAYFQLGVVILLLNFYTNQTITHFEYSASWIIALVTPITIEFILNFFLEIDYYSQQQTYITMIITWYRCFMLQISQNFNIQIDYSFDSILIASCKLLGAQYQVIVMLIKFFINRINNQNNLVMTDQNEKLEYFKQVTITFTSIIMVIFLYIRYGYGFMIEFSWEYFNNQIDYIQLTTVRFLPIFGIAYHLAQFLIF